MGLYRVVDVTDPIEREEMVVEAPNARIAAVNAANQGMFVSPAPGHTCVAEVYPAAKRGTWKKRPVLVGLQKVWSVDYSAESKL